MKSSSKTTPVVSRPSYSLFRLSTSSNPPLSQTWAEKRRMPRVGSNLKSVALIPAGSCKSEVVWDVFCSDMPRRAEPLMYANVSPEIQKKSPASDGGELKSQVTGSGCE